VYLQNLLRPYWMLKVASVLLKLAAVALLVLFCGRLFEFLRIRSIGLGSVEGTTIAESLVPMNALMDFIIRYVVLIIGAYAGGQLIDLFMSIELSLKTLAARRRQPITEVNHEG